MKCGKFWRNSVLFRYSYLKIPLETAVITAILVPGAEKPPNHQNVPTFSGIYVNLVEFCEFPPFGDQCSQNTNIP